MKKRITALVLATAMVLGLIGCSAPSDPTASTGGSTVSETVSTVANQTGSDGEKTLTYALGSQWSTLIPYNASNFYNWAIADKLFDTLIRVTEDYQIEPRNAESWSMNEDSTVLTLNLNKDAKWHDGEPVTAHDWEFTMKLIAQPEMAQLATKTYLAPLVGIDESGNEIAGEEIGCKALDDYTLEITLKDPTYAEAFFLAYGIYYFVLPQHLLEDIPVDQVLTDEFWYSPIGSGPFKFVSEIAGSEIRMTAFTDYYLGSPKVDNLVYKVVAAANMSTAMMAGEIDVAYPGIAPDEAKSLEGQSGVGIQRCEGRMGQMWLALNNEKFSKPIRQAFNYAIDKQMIIDQLLLGEGVVGETNIAPGTPDYNDQITSGRDLEKARQLLEENGWDFDQTITIVIPGGIREKIAAILQQNFAEVGVKAEVQVMDFATLIAGVEDGTYDMCLISNFGNALPAQWTVQLNPNIKTFSKDVDDTCYNKLLEVNAETDPEKRHELILEYQEIFADELPYIIIYNETIFSLVAPGVENITINTSDAAWNWEKN